MKVCSKCESTDCNVISPAWMPKNQKVYSCSTCGFISDEYDREVVTGDKLRDIFRGTTLAEHHFPDIQEATPEAKAVMYARLMAFATDVWMDGLKQGLLYGKIWCKK